MLTVLHTCMVARWYKGWYIMQAVIPVNIAMMNRDRKQKSRGKWIIC